MVKGVRVLQELEEAKGKGVRRVRQGMEGIKEVALRRTLTARVMLLSRSASRPEGGTSPRVATTVARKHCSKSVSVLTRICVTACTLAIMASILHLSSSLLPLLVLL